MNMNKNTGLTAYHREDIWLLYNKKSRLSTNERLKRQAKFNVDTKQLLLLKSELKSLRREYFFVYIDYY